MKVTYDKAADALYIAFREGKVDETIIDKSGIILDYDKVGDVMGIEVLEASKKIKNPLEVVYEVS